MQSFVWFVWTIFPWDGLENTGVFKTFSTPSQLVTLCVRSVQCLSLDLGYVAIKFEFCFCFTRHFLQDALRNEVMQGFSFHSINVINAKVSHMNKSAIHTGLNNWTLLTLDVRQNVHTKFPTKRVSSHFRNPPPISIWMITTIGWLNFSQHTNKPYSYPQSHICDRDVDFQ